MYEEPISILNSSEVSQRAQDKASPVPTVWPHNLLSGHLLTTRDDLSGNIFQSAAYTYHVLFLLSWVAVLHPQVFPDNAAGREIASLPARCLNEGCSWTGSIKQYEVSVKIHLVCAAAPWCRYCSPKIVYSQTGNVCKKCLTLQYSLLSLPPTQLWFDYYTETVTKAGSATRSSTLESPWQPESNRAGKYQLIKSHWDTLSMTAALAVGSDLQLNSASL